MLGLHDTLATRHSAQSRLAVSQLVGSYCVGMGMMAVPWCARGTACDKKERTCQCGALYERGVSTSKQDTRWKTEKATRYQLVTFINIQLLSYPQLGPQREYTSECKFARTRPGLREIQGRVCTKHKRCMSF